VPLKKIQNSQRLIHHELIQSFAISERESRAGAGQLQTLGSHLIRLGVIRCCVGVMFIQSPALFMRVRLCTDYSESVCGFRDRPLESCPLRGVARQHLVLGLFRLNIGKPVLRQRLDCESMFFP
jgi:hypothetical protein